MFSLIYSFFTAETLYDGLKIFASSTASKALGKITSEYIVPTALNQMKSLAEKTTQFFKPRKQPHLLRNESDLANHLSVRKI